MSTVTVREFLRSTSFSEDEHEQDPMEFVTSRFARDRQNSISEITNHLTNTARTSRNSQCQLRSQETILEHEYKYRTGNIFIFQNLIKFLKIIERFLIQQESYFSKR